MLKSLYCRSLSSFGVCCEEGKQFTLSHADRRFPITVYEGGSTLLSQIGDDCGHKHLSVFKVI